MTSYFSKHLIQNELQNANKYVLYTEDVEREIQIETLSIHHLIIYKVCTL